MWTALRQWLGASRQEDRTVGRPPRHAPAAAARAATAVPDGPLPDGTVLPDPTEAAVVHGFSALLIGVAALCERQPSAVEQSVLRRLGEAARATGEEHLVPRMPAVLPKLIGLIRRDDVAVHELTELLGREPALLGEVMRVANSPFYRGTQTLTSLEAAVAQLGQRGIHDVVSRAVMAPVFDLKPGRLNPAAGTLLWEQADGCARACARECAGAAERFDAYLAGMVANTGLIVALRLLEQPPAGAAPASLDFHRQLATLSPRLSARIARQWCLPDTVVLAVESLAEPADGAVSGLAAALRRADRASKAQVMADLGGAGSQDAGPDHPARGRAPRVFR